MRLMCSKPATSNSSVLSLKNLRRLNEARLQAVLSRNIYSLQGFDALIWPSSGQVCHSLIVVSNCTPGSAQRQAAFAILSHNSREGTLLITLLSVLASRFQSSPF